MSNIHLTYISSVAVTFYKEMLGGWKLADFAKMLKTVFSTKIFSVFLCLAKPDSLA